MNQIELNFPASVETHPLRRRWLGTALYWRFQAAGWAAYLACVCSAAILLEQDGTPWTELAMMALLSVAGLVHTHLLRILLLRLRRRARSLWRLAACLLPWCLAQAVAMGATVFGMSILWIPRTIERSEFGSSSGVTECLALGALCFPLLCCWCGLYYGCLAYRQYQLGRLERLALDAAVKEAELRALKSQVNPHFLFNSLNSLRALISEEEEAPRTAVTQLADFLRSSLIFGQHELIPLSRELELVDNYLALEQLRHEERLRVVRDIDPSACRFPVPPFVLQTVVENAVKYGIATREEGGTVSISATAGEGGLVLRVTNPGTIGAGGSSVGVGLTNARARLRLLFGDRARLTLRQAGDALVVAEVAVPAAARPSDSPVSST